MNKKWIITAAIICSVPICYYVASLATINVYDIEKVEVLNIGIQSVHIRITMNATCPLPTYLPPADYQLYINGTYIGPGKTTGTFINSGENLIVADQEVMYSSVPSLIITALTSNGTLEVRIVVSLIGGNVDIKKIVQVQ